MLSLLLLAQFVACNNENESLDPNEPKNNYLRKRKHNFQELDRLVISAPLIWLPKMEVGWNLGNSFDLESRDNTYWGNPITSKAMIDEVKAMGFSTLRIPITWGPNQGEMDPYAIDPLLSHRNKKSSRF